MAQAPSSAGSSVPAADPLGYAATSYWLESCGDDLSPRPALRGELDADVAILGAVLPIAERDGLIIRRTSSANARRVVADTRAIANVSADVAGSYGPIDPRGIALEHARATVAAAMTTLERLATDGWSSVLGSPLDRPGVARLGADAVVERTDSFDPFQVAGPAPDVR